MSFCYFQAIHNCVRPLHKLWGYQENSLTTPVGLDSLSVGWQEAQNPKLWQLPNNKGLVGFGHTSAHAYRRPARFSVETKGHQGGVNHAE